MMEMNSMPDQEAQTERYLKTNGPPPGAFDLSEEEESLLHVQTDFEKMVLRSSLKGNKQNTWIIGEIIGLKGAHRGIHGRLREGDERFKRTDELIAQRLKDENERFAKIDATLDVFSQLRAKWLDRKKVVRNVLLAVCTILVLPFISQMGVEIIKHFLHWP